jgi:Domain of unknown function (DUF4338)
MHTDAPELPPNLEEVRSKLLFSLRDQGFELVNNLIVPAQEPTKSDLRSVHASAVAHVLERSGRALKSKEQRFIRDFIASGHEVDPERMSPALVEVTRNSVEEELFRYIKLHWSIPVSAGYGRRLRYIIFDEHNGKVIGILGLCDPVFAVKPRDQWIGWTHAEKKQRLKSVVEAFVVGAVPPYSSLLCGKLVALLATSNEVRDSFAMKYKGKSSAISEIVHDGKIALITTASALGRSSLYNRLRIDDRDAYRSVGFTSGSGDFHFINGVYAAITEVTHSFAVPTAKNVKWGGGFRNRREVIRKCLKIIGLPDNLQYHGVKRELFVAPLGSNTPHYLQCKVENISYFDNPATEISEFFRHRWLLPRATRHPDFRIFDPQSYRLWKT